MANSRSDMVLWEAIKLNESASRAFEQKAQILAGALLLFLPLSLSALSAWAETPRMDDLLITLCLAVPILAAFRVVIPARLSDLPPGPSLFPETKGDPILTSADLTDDVIAAALSRQYAVVVQIRQAKGRRFSAAIWLAAAAVAVVVGVRLFERLF